MEYFLSITKGGISIACDGPNPKAEISITIRPPCTPYEASTMLKEAGEYLKTHDADMEAITGSFNKIATSHGYHRISLPEAASVLRKREV